MNQENTTETADKKPQSLASSIFDYMEIFVFAAVVVILLLTFGFRICVVDGPSMNNTLEENERLLISDLFYTPEYGDIVVFHQTGDDERLNKPIVKRVIATGGQYVKIDYAKKLLYVSDDAVFDESDIKDEGSYAYFSGNYWRSSVGKDSTLGQAVTKGIQVPEGQLFVMGDNRNDSLDSRSDKIGFVDEHRVLGRVILRLTPFAKFGSV
ncbi:MAG: signal peptidase I [Clostridia bacterium]|nr:signal peptidase I [Clostridia bacterium]